VLRLSLFLVSWYKLMNQHPLDLAKVRMQTAHLRIGMFHTIKNVFHNEGICLAMHLNRQDSPTRFSRFIQWPICIATTTSDIFNCPIWRVRTTKRILFYAWAIRPSRSINPHGLRRRMVFISYHVNPLTRSGSAAP
jgi:hypothetical protein